MAVSIEGSALSQLEPPNIFVPYGSGKKLTIGTNSRTQGATNKKEVAEPQKRATLCDICFWVAMATLSVSPGGHWCSSRLSLRLAIYLFICLVQPKPRPIYKYQFDVQQGAAVGAEPIV